MPVCAQHAPSARVAEGPAARNRARECWQQGAVHTHTSIGRPTRPRAGCALNASAGTPRVLSVQPSAMAAAVLAPRASTTPAEAWAEALASVNPLLDVKEVRGCLRRVRARDRAHSPSRCCAGAGPSGRGSHAGGRSRRWCRPPARAPSRPEPCSRRCDDGAWRWTARRTRKSVQGSASPAVRARRHGREREFGVRRGRERVFGVAPRRNNRC
jgi:hypothetical protein